GQGLGRQRQDAREEPARIGVAAGRREWVEAGLGDAVADAPRRPLARERRVDAAERPPVLIDDGDAELHRGDAGPHRLDDLPERILSPGIVAVEKAHDVARGGAEAEIAGRALPAIFLVDRADAVTEAID